MKPFDLETVPNPIIEKLFGHRLEYIKPILNHLTTVCPVDLPQGLQVYVVIQHVS